MSASPHEFPSPVGGVPFPLDFAPSVLFSVLYGILLPIIILRQVNPRTRQFVLIGTMVFSIERIVVYVLRATAARDASTRQNESIMTYFQTTLGGGAITIGQDLNMLARALLVSATQPGAKTTSDPTAAGDTELAKEKPLEDHPKIRSWVRGWTGVAALVFLVSIVLNIMSGVNYKNAVKSGSQAASVQQLRYGSTAVELFLLVTLAFGTVWVSTMLPRVPKSSVIWIVIIASLLSTECTYRLVVMRDSTTSLYSFAPGSLNSAGAKAAFYVFHVAPEYVAATILVCLNVRRVFATGLWGDIAKFSRAPKK